MNSSIRAFFQFTRAQVTEEDIINFSPGDPGYREYVELWTGIWQSGDIPSRADFNLSEVISLTGWAEPGEWKEPERFRCYRRFTTSVGIALLHSGNDSECVRPSNYLARDLVIDLDRSNQEYFSLVRAVARSTREVLIAAESEEGYPFFTFVEMLLAQLSGDWESAESAASQLIKDENAVRQSESMLFLSGDVRFLLGLTCFDQLHRDWIAFAAELRNPNQYEDTQLVIDEFAQSWL